MRKKRGLGYKSSCNIFLAIIVFLLLLGNISYGINIDDPGDNKLSNLLQSISKMKHFENSKIETNIISLLEADNLEELDGFKYEQFDFVDDKVRLEVILTDGKFLDSLNGFNEDFVVENHYKNLVQVLIPVDLIRELSELEYIQYIRSPIKPHLLDITSEGVEVIEADLLQNEGINGFGIKVAVIDLGFEDYSTNPELPSERIKEVKSFRSDGDIECSEEHGSACAEIILDVAPQADLYLYNFDTISEFNDAVSHAISKNVDIISFSVGWLGINDYDGTGYSIIGGGLSNNIESD